MYWLQLMDKYAANWSVLIIAIIECILIAWKYGSDRFLNDIQSMIGKQGRVWRMFWTVMWKFVTPVVLLVIFFLRVVWRFTSCVTCNFFAVYSVFQLGRVQTSVLRQICLPYMGWRCRMGGRIIANFCDNFNSNSANRRSTEGIDIERGDNDFF